MMRGYGGYGGGYGGMMDGGVGGILMLFFGLLVLIGIVMLVMWAVRASSGQHGHMMPGGQNPVGGPPLPHGQVGHHEAVAIAKRRLASGEITPEQYQEIIKTLGN